MRGWSACCGKGRLRSGLELPRVDVTPMQFGFDCERERLDVIHEGKAAIRRSSQGSQVELRSCLVRSGGGGGDSDVDAVGSRQHARKRWNEGGALAGGDFGCNVAAARLSVLKERRCLKGLRGVMTCPCFVLVCVSLWGQEASLTFYVVSKPTGAFGPSFKESRTIFPQTVLFRVRSERYLLQRCLPGRAALEFNIIKT